MALKLNKKRIIKKTFISEIQDQVHDSIQEINNVNEKNDKTYGHPIDRFMQENRYAETILRELKKLIRKLERNNFDATWNQIEDLVKQLKDIELHYKRKEEILFPYLEKYNVTDLSSAFASEHKEIKKRLRNLSQSIKNKNIDNINSLYIDVSKLIRKVILDEDQILFPAALSKLSFKEWSEIRKLSLEIGYSWIENSIATIDRSIKSSNETLEGFTLDTGFMTLDMIDLVLNNIEPEVTIINEKGIITYYNKNLNRIFRREPDIIGTKYEDMFTGKNSKNMKKIIDTLKKKKKDFIEIYFEEQENTIYIKYIPLFDKKEKFIGVMETIQNISYYKDISGEKSEF